MTNSEDMDKRVKATLDSIEFISEVKVSPFFKENVMHKVRNISEDVQEATWSWFSPKVQLATLVCVVVLNVMAFNNVRSSTYDSNLSQFAETYGLSSSQTSILE